MNLRCAATGVSVINAEVALVFVQEHAGRFRPAALPLFGTCDETGAIVDINEGPNSDILVTAFERLREDATVEVDFDSLGLEEMPTGHIETMVSLVMCSQIHGAKAVRTQEGELGIVLFSAHVAAALMDTDPELALDTPLEDLAGVVFEGEFAKSVYAILAKLPIRLRCKFGLSLAGLLSLDQEMARRAITWAPSFANQKIAPAQRALWLAEAMMNFADNAAVIDALQDYADEERELG